MTAYEDLITGQGAVGYWRGDEASAFTDQIGAVAYTGVSTPQYNNADTVHTDVAAGCLLAEGEDGYVYLGNSHYDATGLYKYSNATFSCWFKFDTLPSDAGLYCCIYNQRYRATGSGSGNNSGWFLWVRAADNLLIHSWLTNTADGDPSGSYAHSVFSKYPIAVGVWYHAACQMENGNVGHLYLNGVYQGSTYQTPSEVIGWDSNDYANNSFGYRLQKFATIPSCEVKLQGLSMFNSVLTSAQISAQYNTLAPVYGGQVGIPYGESKATISLFRRSNTANDVDLVSILQPDSGGNWQSPSLDAGKPYLFLNEFHPTPRKWRPTKNYKVGDWLRKPVANAVDGYEVTADDTGTGTGVTGGSEPTWPTVIGNTVVSGNLTLEYKGTLQRPQVHIAEE